jgi:hypothetical protein
MPRSFLQHRHEPDGYEVVAVLMSHDSGRRHGVTIASCLVGRHSVWWTAATSDADTRPYTLDRLVRRGAVVAITWGIVCTALAYVV